MKQTLRHLKDYKSYKICSQTLRESSRNQNKEITRKSTNTFKLNNTLLNNPWVREEVSK